MTISNSCFAITHQEIDNHKAHLVTAKSLLSNSNFNGAIICGFISNSLNDVSATEQHSENAFNIGLKSNYTYTEIMTGMALALEIYKSSFNFYIEGFIAGIDKGLNADGDSSSIKLKAKEKLFKLWDKSNNCMNGKSTSEY